MNPAAYLLDHSASRMILVDLVLLSMVALWTCCKTLRRFPIVMQVGYLSMLLGVSLNWLIATCNGFQMPVVGLPWYVPSDYAWRLAGRGDHLLWLADRFYYRIGSTILILSVGDYLLGIGFATFLLSYLSIRFNRERLRSL